MVWRVRHEQVRLPQRRSHMAPVSGHACKQKRARCRKLIRAMSGTEAMGRLKMWIKRGGIKCGVRWLRDALTGAKKSLVDHIRHYDLQQPWNSYNHAKRQLLARSIASHIFRSPRYSVNHPLLEFQSINSACATARTPTANQSYSNTNADYHTSHGLSPFQQLVPNRMFIRSD